jgi:hypothetical protein
MWLSPWLQLVSPFAWVPDQLLLNPYFWIVDVLIFLRSLLDKRLAECVLENTIIHTVVHQGSQLHINCNQVNMKMDYMCPLISASLSSAFPKVGNSNSLCYLIKLGSNLFIVPFMRKYFFHMSFTLSTLCLIFMLLIRWLYKTSKWLIVNYRKSTFLVHQFWFIRWWQELGILWASCSFSLIICCF